MPALDAQTAVVTGAGSGLGRAIALDLAHAGARVIIMELNPAFDSDGRTARVAAHMFLTFLRGLAEREAGALREETQ